MNYRMAITLIIEIIIFALIVYKWNPFDISDKYPAQIAIIFLLGMFLQLMYLFFIKEKTALDIQGLSTPNRNQFMKKLLYTLGAFTLIVVSIIGIWWLLRHIPSMPTANTITMWIINSLIITGILGVVYLFAKPLIAHYSKSPNKNTLASFIGNLIFYIPCMFIKLIDYLKHEYNITTKTTWIILLLEVILIAAKFLIPEIWRKIVTHDGQHLLEDPVYLNSEHTLGNYEGLHENTIGNSSTGESSKNGKFKYNYSLSAWFYINPQPPNTNSSYTKYTTILDYGNKPLVQYNGKTSTLRVQTEINKGDLITVYKTNNIMYQKWNNIVINYDGGHMDIFINGDLVASRKNIAPYMTYENVKVGAENGIYGGICNVVYYNRTLSRSVINLVYKSLREKLFPVL